MRVIFLAGTYCPAYCGVADYTAQLRQQLQQRQIESIVLTTHDAPTPSDTAVQAVIAQWHWTTLWPLVRSIQAQSADLLHIQHAAGTYGFDRSIFLLPLLLKRLGWSAPIITTVHEYGWWEWQPRGIPPNWIESLKTWGQERGWWDREDGFLLTQSEAIITTNAAAATAIRSRLPNLKAPLYRIPIAANVSVASIDRELAKQQVRQEFGWSTETQILAFFGFLHPVKGLETLLPAFRQVLAVVPQARLLLLGSVESLALPAEAATQYWQQLQQLIDRLGLHETVHMTGYQEANKISEYLAGADVGVLPFNPGVTLKSGSLLTLMAHALPIVATQSSPPDPDLDPKDWLRFVAPRDPDALATQLIDLLGQPELRQQMGQAGYHFSQQFSWPAIADAHLEVYEMVLRSRTMSDCIYQRHLKYFKK